MKLAGSEVGLLGYEPHLYPSGCVTFTSSSSTLGLSFPGCQEQPESILLFQWLLRRQTQRRYVLTYTSSQQKANTRLENTMAFGGYLVELCGSQTHRLPSRLCKDGAEAGGAQGADIRLQYT